MPFELGLTIASTNQMGALRCFVFEAREHRLSKSLSDLDGTDPYIHGGNPEGVLRELSNALYRADSTPQFVELLNIYRDLKAAASKLKSEFPDGSLFAALPFRELVMVATLSASERISFLRRD